MLVRMLRERWSTIKSKSTVQSNEIDEAEQVYERFADAHAERNRHADQMAAMASDRQRAFTLVLRTTTRAARVATYLRWKTDAAEQFAPSLWAGRGTRTDLASKSDALAASPSPRRWRRARPRRRCRSVSR